MSWVLFDLDGTLADSIPTLYGIYEQFMVRHGKQATREEFASLNGPSLAECIARLRRRHALAGDDSSLLAEYEELIRQGYRNSVRARPGAGETLEELRRRGHRLMLVTSGRRGSAWAFVERMGWADHFEGGAFGDEVEQGKPAPDIYLLAMERAGLQAPDAVVVEDSPNGVRAGRSAGAYVIGITGDAGARELLDAGADRVVDDLRQLLQLSGPYDLEAEVVATGEIEVGWADRPWEARHTVERERIWSEDPRVRRGEVFDAPMLAVDRVVRMPSGARVEGFWAGYRDYYLQRSGLAFQQGIRPIGVSGITVNDGRVLVARRSDRVTAYPGRLELVPSGSLDDVARRTDGGVDCSGKILEELQEETGIEPRSVRRVQSVALTYDPRDRCYDAVFRIELDGAPDPGGSTGGEYRDLEWVPLGELRVHAESRPRDVVPVTRALTEMLALERPRS